MPVSATAVIGPPVVDIWKSLSEFVPVGDGLVPLFRSTFTISRAAFVDAGSPNPNTVAASAATIVLGTFIFM
jgi:hypothetical protein